MTSKAEPTNQAEPGKANTANSCGVATGGAVLPEGRIAQNAVATDFNVLASKSNSTVDKGDVKFCSLSTVRTTLIISQDLYSVI